MLVQFTALCRKFISKMHTIEVTDKIDIELLVNLQLPTLPAGAMRVAKLAQDYNSSTKAIADAIGTDPALAGLVLSRANSPLYAMERLVTTLPKAISAMGNEAIHSLVVTLAFSNVFSREIRASKIGQAIWKHSLAVGILARELSLELGLRGAEEAFTCGLLHDIGKFLLLKYDSVLYSQIAEKETEREMLGFERINFGYMHDQVGALAVRRWGMPEEISHVIFNHHQPSEAEQFMLMSRVVDIANQMAHATGWGIRAQEWSQLYTIESVIALGFSDEQLNKVWEKTEAKLQELTGQFK